MNVEPLSIPSVLLITPRLFGDDRGFFLETWNARKHADAGIPGPWVQDNMSVSVRGVLRGLHCQVRQTQGKLVSCPSGSLFDVAVDLRGGSPTFGKWCGAVLDGEKQQALWVPPGFAHGYYVLSERATLTYKVTDFYAPEHDKCLRWDDADVGIDWPLIPGFPPLLSPKDERGESLTQAREWFR
jgi:dTDP-4-dehydrorhamnose 3,5-epimerase